MPSVTTPKTLKSAISAWYRRLDLDTLSKNQRAAYSASKGTLDRHAGDVKLDKGAEGVKEEVCALLGDVGYAPKTIAKYMSVLYKVLDYHYGPDGGVAETEPEEVAEPVEPDSDGTISMSEVTVERLGKLAEYYETDVETALRIAVGQAFKGIPI